jgi:hypothetical protein
MGLQIYRDIACADGCALIAELVFRLTANGWTYVAHGTGTGGARSASQPATAADLATALRTAPNSWVCVSRGNRKVSWQRNSTANPSYTSWRYEYTATGALTTGSATAPDRHSTDSQYASGNNFRIVAPATAGTADAMKVHIVVDDAGPSFVALTRRTPLPAGNVGAFSVIFLDLCTAPVWSANPDPVVVGMVGNDTNTANTEMVQPNYNNAWLGYGLPSPAWTAIGLENPGAVAGSTTADKSGVDVLYQARWAFASGAGIVGTSALFRLLHPGRTPVVGIDAGGTLTWAAFWTVAVANDGTALGS